MKDEIKEILDMLKDDIYIPSDDNRTYKLLDKDDTRHLLDYITNLQEELEDLREDNYAYHQLMKMQNQREYRSKFLKEFQEEYNTNTFPDYDEVYKRYDKLKKENEKLKEKTTNLQEIAEEHKNCTRKHWQQKCAEHCANEMIYKSRNEKANWWLKEMLKQAKSEETKAIISGTLELLLNDDE